MNRFLSGSLLACTPLLLPLVVRWGERMEARSLAEGIPLSAREIELARGFGVRYPEKIRCLTVDYIPGPDHPVLRFLGRVVGLVGGQTAGICFRYGIFLRADYAAHPLVRLHECVHTAQYERLGGFAPFLREYLRQCLECGYPAAPLEREAVLATTRLFPPRG